MTLRQRFALIALALGLRQRAFVVRMPDADDQEIEAAVRAAEAHRRSPAGRREEDLRQIAAATERAARC